MLLKALFKCFSLATLAAAHGRITNIRTSKGDVYIGWDPEAANAPKPLPSLAAWTASNLGNIYISPAYFNTSHLACHFNATPGLLHVNASTGDSLRLQWNEWPVSHKGPVLNYLAYCGESCTNTTREQLEWVKIDELGWLNSSGWEGLGGTWATDVLIANNFTWTVEIPETLKEGAYVLRHEIIALHVADGLDGAQAYPQCVNINVKKGLHSNSTDVGFSGGVIGSKLYSARDKGILVDIHGKIDGYEIPGPKLWSGIRRTKQPNE